MRFTHSQTSFKAGRLSPKLYNRVDTKQYQDGCSQLSGFRILPEGGAERLKGYKVVHDPDILALVPAVTAQNQPKVFSFTVYSLPISCVIYMESDNSVTLRTLPYGYNYGDHEEIELIQAGNEQYDPQLFDWTVLENQLILTHYRGDMAPYIITFDDTGAIDTALTMLYAGGGGELGITIPNANYGFGGVFPFFLGITLSEFACPMSDLENVPSTLDIGTWDTVNLKRNITSTDADVAAILQRSPVIYLEGLGTGGFGEGFDRTAIISDYYVVTATVANGVTVRPCALYTGDRDVFEFFSVGDVRLHLWAHSLWYNGNFPRTVTTSECRVVFGGTPEKPLTFFGSKVNAPLYFNQIRRPDTLCELFVAANPKGNTLPTDPYVFTASSKEDGEITFAQVAQTLVLGTDRKVHIGSGGDTILSAVSVNLKTPESKGADPLRATSTGKAVYYIGSDGRKLVKFKYNGENGSYMAQDLHFLFSDLLDDDTMRSVCWCPNISAVLIVMDSGNVYAITDDGENNIAFWDTGLTNVVSACYVSARQTGSVLMDYGSHILLLMEGAGLCVFEPDNWPGTSLTDGSVGQYITHYLDRAYYMSNEGSNIWGWQGDTIDTSPDAGIPVDTTLFPSGTEVYIVDWSTGLYDIVTTTTTGTTEVFPFTTNVPSSVAFVIVGKAVPTAQLATMPIEAGQQWGTAQMGIKNIDTIAIRYYKSFSFEVGSDGEDWQEWVVADNEGNATTGRTTKKFSASPRHDQIIYIRNTKPEPLTITGINMRGVSNDG